MREGGQSDRGIVGSFTVPLIMYSPLQVKSSHVQFLSCTVPFMYSFFYVQSSSCT